MLKYIAVILFILGSQSATAQDICNCKGYAGLGGPCYAGLGGPAYDGPGGPAFSGPGGPCYSGLGGTGANCPSICK